VFHLFVGRPAKKQVEKQPASERCRVSALYGGNKPTESETMPLISSQAQRAQNDLKGLNLIHRFGWLRAAELGQLFWPNGMHAGIRANRLIRGWVERKFVLERSLPEGAGRAIVLAEAGARLLRKYTDINAKSGKDWGETQGEKWTPALTWKHDLIATGVLAELAKQGFEIRTEREIRDADATHLAVPDGLAWRLGETIWLEVEHARKTGRAMRFLAEKLSWIYSEEGTQILGRRVTRAIVAYRAEGMTDERGFSIDHRHRVTNGIKAYAKHPVRLSWAICESAGAGVGAIEFREEVILPEAALAIAKRLQWEYTPASAELDAHSDAYYNEWLASVWVASDHGGQIYWMIDGAGHAIPVDSISEGKLACAAKLLALGPKSRRTAS
jgi:hypothetical protein